jgi:tetratricopeptide (TPR) repeat protein
MIFTFYSYKGGVGRSMALANVGQWLYLQGLRVVLVDWDLEAPGLESFFCSSREESEKVRSQLGIIDMLTSYKRLYPNIPFAPNAGSALSGPGTAEPNDVHLLTEYLPPVSTFLYPLKAPLTSGIGGGLWLLPAGWRSEDRFGGYAEAVQDLDWEEFYVSFRGEAYFEWLRRQLLHPDVADAVLIDSRTGVTEMGGVCTRQLADAVVAFSAPNTQNLEGVAAMIKSFVRDEIKAKRGRDLPIVVIPTRVDLFNEALRERFKTNFNEKLEKFTPPVFKRLKSSFWALRIPYVPDYSYDEKIAVDRPGSVEDLTDAYKKIAAHLAMLAKPDSALRRRCQGEIERLFGKLLPTVYIAYAREDGRNTAESLKAALENQNIDVWRDPPEGAETAGDWTLYLTQMVDKSRFLVLILTRQSLASPWLVKAWRHARTRGVCVTPVLGDPGAAGALTSLPLWARKAKPLDLSADRQEILLNLSQHCTAPRIPFMCPAPAEHWISRGSVLSQLKQTLIEEGGPQSSFAVLLHGPAGTGKSATAVQFCHDDEIQSAFEVGILWLDLSDGQHLKTELEKAYEALTGEAKSFFDAAQAAEAIVACLSGRCIGEKRCLIVVDNANEGAELEKLVIWGRSLAGCRFLITSRDASMALIANAVPIPLPSLTLAEASQVLIGNLGDAEPETTAFAERMALVLDRNLAANAGLNAVLKQKILTGTPLSSAVRELSRDLEAKGLESLPEPVRHSVENALEQVFENLPEPERKYLRRLAFAPDNQPVDFETAARQCELTTEAAEAARRKWADLALIELGANGRSLALHPLLRHFLKQRHGWQTDPDTAAEAGFVQMEQGEQAFARRILLRLVNVAPAGGAETEKADCKPVTLFDAREQALIARLEQLGLVKVDEAGPGGKTVRLASETLVRRWRRLAGWIVEDREFLVWRQKLDVYLDDWQKDRSDAGALLSGKLLASAADWLTRQSDDLNDAEHAYIAASLANRERKYKYAALLFATALILGAMLSLSLKWHSDSISGAERDRELQVLALIDRGDSSLERADPIGALSEYERALELDPLNPDSLIRRGKVYASLPDAYNDLTPDQAKAAALKDFEAALALSPNNIEALSGRASVYAQEGKTDQAIADYSRIIGVDKNNAGVYLNRAGVYEAAGDLARAVEDYSAAIERNDRLVDAFLNRAKLYERLKNPAAAIADYEKVLVLDGSATATEAARIRLGKLGKTPSAAPALAKKTVYLHFVDQGDQAALEQDLREMLQDKGFTVPAGQWVPNLRTKGDVRYFDRQDEDSVDRIRLSVESALAQLGYKLSLDKIYLDPAKFRNARPDVVEVWIPPITGEPPP